MNTKNILLLFVLFLVTESCILVAQNNIQQQKNSTLLPFDLATTAIDTLSIKRKENRLFLSIYQYPLPDSLSRQKLLEILAHEHKKAFSRFDSLEVRIGFDYRDRKKRILANTKYLRDDKNEMLLTRSYFDKMIIEPLSYWQKEGILRKYWRSIVKDSADEEMMEMLFSKYIYKSDGRVDTLFIEEIPEFRRENKSAALPEILSPSVILNCNLPYKPFAAFANDTINFLRYNFQSRTDCYYRKTVEYVLNDLQLKPMSFTVLPSWHDGEKYEGICIYLDKEGLEQRKQNYRLQPSQYICIYWNEPLNYKDETFSLRKNIYSEGKWMLQHYNLFKNNMVGKVEYYK
jgi:hypothetical protein